jgi:toxin ParE1/3/4
MREVIFSPAAERDLYNIYSYTLGKWGKKQTQEYKQAFNVAFAQLKDSPASLGRNREGVPVGFYLYQVRSHLIIFRFDEVTIEIARILHERMDIKLHQPA